MREEQRSGRFRPPLDLPDEALIFTEAGLSLAGRLLVLHPVEVFDLVKRDGQERERLEALLAIAFRKALDADIIQHFAEAAAYSRRGDHALANLRLATSHLSIVPATDQIALRLDLANELLSSGMTPGALLKALGLGDERGLVRVYNDKQPRNPAGSGSDSGRWVSVSNGAQTASPPEEPKPIALASAAIGVALEVGVIGPSLAPAVLTALAALTAAVGFGATLGLLFVPRSTDDSLTGPLPGDEGTRYDYNKDEGTLRLIDTTGIRPMVVAAGQKDKNGVFWDADTGTPFAREVDGSLVFDASAMADAVRANDKADARAKLLMAAAAATANKNGNLCVDVGLDVAHYASARAALYQFQISEMNNLHRPLQAGLAVSLPNPEGGRPVVFDDCRDADGAMLEAKGPGFERMLRSRYMRGVIAGRWLNQAYRQALAAGKRPVEWYFAEAGAKAFADRLFSAGGIDRKGNVFLPLPIITHHVPEVIR